MYLFVFVFCYCSMWFTCTRRKWFFNCHTRTHKWRSLTLALCCLFLPSFSMLLCTFLALNMRKKDNKATGQSRTLKKSLFFSLRQHKNLKSPAPSSDLSLTLSWHDDEHGNGWSDKGGWGGGRRSGGAHNERLVEEVAWRRVGGEAPRRWKSGVEERTPRRSRQ